MIALLWDLAITLVCLSPAIVLVVLIVYNLHVSKHITNGAG